MAKAELVIWDVQHGNAIYLKTPNNKHIVIDLGVGSYKRHDQGFSPLLHLRNKYKIRRLDYAIITHPHKDHIDDMLNFNALDPKVFLRPKQITRADVMSTVLAKDLPIFEEYFKVSDRYTENISPDDERSITNPENYGGLNIQFFFTPDLPKSNLNNHSIITIVSYSGTKIVLPGDNEIESTNELMKQESFRTAVQNADLLLAPHHGRESAFNTDFVKLVNPNIVVVSDGSYGNTSAIDKYRSYCKGWKVFKNGEGSERKTLSTYNDGVVVIHFGNHGDHNFLEIKTVQ